jgi:hypothetical protein
MSPQRARETFVNAKAMFEKQNVAECGKFFYVPTEGESRVECVWPKFVVMDQNGVQTLLDSQQRALKELENSLSKTSSNQNNDK